MPRKYENLALILSADCLIDDEYWKLALPGVIPSITRTRMPAFGIERDLTAQELVALAESPDIEDAADRLRSVRPIAGAFVDTSITFIRGPGGDIEIGMRISRLLKCPVTVTSTAVVEALQTLGIHRIAVLSPYTEDINQVLPVFLGAHGIEVVRLEILPCNYNFSSSLDMAHVEEDELLRAGEKVAGPDVDGIFIPCTALRTFDAIEPLENLTGKTVITSNQATMWRVQRLANKTGDINGGGRLFED
jgi:maleate isomerase